MRLSVGNFESFISTGGRAFDPEGDVLLFIHGSGQTHLSWVLQGRYFANRGWQVLNPDLPGHGLSAGKPLASVVELADWCADLLQAAGVSRATVIGHSQGGLVAMELARRHPKKVARLALVSCALAIPVNPALLEMAKTGEDKAIASMISWGHDSSGHLHDHSMPGQSHLNYGIRQMAGNSKGVLHVDLQACSDYQEGENAARAVACPTLCVLAGKDRMTPIKFGRILAATIPVSSLREISDGGHMLPAERPLETNRALREFFSAPDL